MNYQQAKAVAHFQLVELFMTHSQIQIKWLLKKGLSTLITLYCRMPNLNSFKLLCTPIDYIDGRT